MHTLTFGATYCAVLPDEGEPEPHNKYGRLPLHWSKSALIEADWGHPLIAPDGDVIRVPLFAYSKLHRLGLKKRYSLQLDPAVYHFLDPKYDTLTDGLRHLLGCDLDGPAWLVCHCRECRHRDGLTDNTPMPGRHSSQLAAELAIRDMRKVSPRRRGLGSSPRSRPAR